MKSLFLILSFTIGINAFGQRLSFEILNSRNGLSHNSVLAIFQDSKGFIWFGTYGGLNKYDGYKIITYKTEYGNKKSLPNNAIVAIHEDRDGLLWLGTYGGGLIQYDPQTDAFTDFRHLHLNPESKIVPNVRSFYEDEQGMLWLASSEGLVRFDKHTRTFKAFRINSDIHADNNIVVLCKGEGNTLWLGSYLGLKKFDLKSGTFKSYKPIETDPTSISFTHILAIHRDETGNLWLGTEGGGLNFFDVETEKFTHYKNNPTDPSSISSNIIYDVKQYTTGEILIATDSGINIFKPSTKKFIHYVNDPKEPTSISNNNIRAIYQDKNGILWIGTDGGGVNKLDSQKKSFNLFQHHADDNNSLSSNNVFAITGDENGMLWIGTIGGGLNRYNPKGKQFSHFLPNERNPHSISSTKILSLSKGPSGNLWIGTDRDGLCMLPKNDLTAEPSKANFFRYVRSDLRNNLNSNVIYSVLEDKQGIVWAGTWSRGINKLVFNERLSNGDVNYGKPTITRFRHNVNDPESISNDVIFTIYEDRSGTLWFGTVGGGLEKHEIVKRDSNGTSYEKDIFVHYQNNPDDSASLSNNGVTAIFESSKGEFWIGTSIGLNRLDRNTGKFKVYTTKDGLADNVVFGITEDKKGNLWIGTLGGMSKFNPATGSFRNYSFEDGILDNMFNPHAFHVLPSGEMFFGGPMGITSFYPDSIQDNPFTPQVMFTNFKVLNRQVPIGKDKDGQERLNKTITTAEEINLSHKDYVFSIEFSASNYAIPEKNRYAYKMEGFDQEWRYTTADNRIATYTNLNPGSYTFRVKAANCDGVWNDNGAWIRINITPPFWKTVWFKVLVALASMGLLFLIYKLRINIIQRQKKALEQQVHDRTREIMSQKEEIESQKENIEEKNKILEIQFKEITLKNAQITEQNTNIEMARREIDATNKKLSEYNLTLEQHVKERTEQLRTTLENLAETNKELDQFIYRSAHDLKGPLASITGLTYLGRMETDDPKVVDLLGRLEYITEGMLDKLSRLTKIHEFNTMDVKLETIDFQSFFEDIFYDVGGIYSMKDIVVDVNVEQDKTFLSDKTLLKILLRNVIENAVKYKDPLKKDHYIKIDVTQKAGASRISISDNGIGIPENQAERVFDLFVVATEKIQGFGMGLYEAKLIARRLGGSIKLNYPPSGDTEFIITI